jgi:transposase
MIHETIKHRAIIHYKHYLRSFRKVSKIYNISKSTLHRWVSKDTPKTKCKIRRKRKPIKQEIIECIDHTLKLNPFATLDYVSKECLKQCNINLSYRSFSRYFKTLGYTLKKAYRNVDYKHDNNNIQKFCKDYNIASNENLICIDEAGFYFGDHLQKGWSKRGQKVRFKSGTWEKTYFDHGCIF